MLEGEFPKPDTEAWRYELPDTEDVETAVIGGAVYVRTDGEIHALDASDGEREWKADVDATGSPAMFDGTIYVTGDRHLMALDTADESLADPTIAFETIYLVVDGALHALNPADGSTRWKLETLDVRADAHFYKSDERVPTPFRQETVAVANGTVYAALEGATFTDERDGEEDTTELSCGFGAVDAETGDREWGVAFTPLHAGGDTTAPITASEAVVNTNLAGGEGNYRLSTADGSGGYRERSVRAGTETTFVQNHWDMNGLLTVRDHEDGNHWSVRSDVHAWESPIVVGDTLIADHYATPPEHVESDYPERSIVAFDIANGSDRWVLDFDEELLDSGGRPTAAGENTLYLETVEALVALRASDSAPDNDEPGDEDGSDDEDEGESDVDDPDDDESPQNDDPCCEDEDGDGGDTDDGTGENGDGDDGSNDGGDGTESNGDTPESDEDDSMPGFTTGAGILGGVATLEWLRRKAGVNESTGVDDPAE